MPGVDRQGDRQIGSRKRSGMLYRPVDEVLSGGEVEGGDGAEAEHQPADGVKGSSESDKTPDRGEREGDQGAQNDVPGIERRQEITCRQEGEIEGGDADGHASTQHWVGHVDRFSPGAAPTSIAGRPRIAFLPSSSCVVSIVREPNYRC